MGEEFVRDNLGVVVIGRNEGERLLCCLRSVGVGERPVVYVDSGSDDDSVKDALDLGAEVVNLDISIPFTAARARNAGWQRLLEMWPQVQLVQFLDGDCELVDGWIEKSKKVIFEQRVAVVCGRRRERFPNRNFYHRLCDMEWDTPVGEADACGGDALMRIEALQQVGGFDDSSIAGEEPELCFRLRQAGWKILRIDADMTMHDAAMFRLRQWWQRSKRAGHAYAGNYRRHKQGKFRLAELKSACFWGFGFPLFVILSSIFLSPLALLLFFVYPLQVLRIAWRASLQQPTIPWRYHFLYACNCVGSKFPHVAGILDEIRSHRRGLVQLIEYK